VGGRGVFPRLRELLLTPRSCGTRLRAPPRLRDALTRAKDAKGARGGRECPPYMRQNQGRRFERAIFLCWAIVRRREARVPIRRAGYAGMLIL